MESGGPGPGEGEDGGGARRRLIVWLAAGALAAGALVGVLIILLGGGDGSGNSAGDDLQVVRFEKASSVGQDPFTKPADRRGSSRVRPKPTGGGGGGEGVGSGPFGGTGSDRVCDRDLLIRSLRARPERLRAFAQVLGISPTVRAVTRYIARLHPVTLTKDTRVTNHSFSNGQVTELQSILAAGTTVLVDDFGKPVVRCRCGNPLTAPAEIKDLVCRGCPPRYRPPEQCDLWVSRRSYRRTYYPHGGYTNEEYDEIYVRRGRRGPFGDCYLPYPEPPTVTIVDVFRPEPEREPEPRTAPEPSPPPQQAPTPPSTGLQCDPPRSQLESEQCAELRGNAPQHTPVPEPQPPPTPADICNDGLDNEGVSGLVDGDDPNCQ